MINRLEPGARQISASGWNEIRDKINNLAPGQNTILTGVKNPFLINVKNNASSGLDILSVVKIGNATYANRTESVFKQKAAECGTELNVSTPSGETDDIAILQQAIPAGGIGKAVADGCTPAFIYKDEAEHTYKYAKPIQDNSAYLKGCDEATNIRVLWHGSGTGKVNAYVCLDATGEGDPLKVAAKMPNTDNRPEGAFYLDTTDTWLYADAIDSFDKENDSNPPAIANPCGYPSDRPVIVAKCEGFKGIEDDSSDSSSNSNPAPEMVAIACDVRDYFIINAGKDGTTTPTHDTTIFKKGSLHYIRWTGSYWEPSPWNETSSSSTMIKRPSGTKLVVCQRDMPDNWTKEFRMPYCTPEMNYGVPPKLTSKAIGIGGCDRCGVKPGEHEFTDKCLDYAVVTDSNTKGISFVYEPVFETVALATGVASSVYGVTIGLGNEEYDCYLPTPGTYSGAGCPDIYEYDELVVLFDCTSYTATGIDYPRDYAEGTIMPWYRAAPWSNPIYPGRGWEQYVPTGGQGEITAVNIDKTSSHYDSSSDCVWVEAGTNDKIPVKEGSLCFIRKIKTNALIQHKCGNK